MIIQYGHREHANQVKEGEIIVYENEYYMKIDTIDYVLDKNEEIDDLKLGNAINVRTGEIRYISDLVAVMHEAKLVI